MANRNIKDNAWFVGVTPRRNPEIVVGVLFEGGEHGQFAARIAAQVIKAYVEKQRRQPTKMAQGGKKVEIGAVWNSASPDGRSGHFARRQVRVECRKSGAAGGGGAGSASERVICVFTRRLMRLCIVTSRAFDYAEISRKRREHRAAQDDNCAIC